MRFLLALLLASPAFAQEPLRLTPVATLGTAKVIRGDTAKVVAPDGSAFIDEADQWYDGRTFDPIDPPFPLPKKGTWFAITTGGAVAVKTKNELLLYPKGATAPAHALTVRGRYVVLSADGRTAVAFDGNDGELEIATRIGGEKEWKWVTHFDDLPAVPVNSTVSPMQVSGDGRMLIWSEGREPHDVFVYDIAARKKRRLELAPKARDNNSYVAGFSPDGTRVALTCCPESKCHLQVFDTATGKRTAAVEGAFGGLHGFSPDGRRVWLSHGNGTLQAFDPTAAKLEPRLDFASDFWNLHFLADGRQALTFAAGVPRRHDLRTGKRLDAHSTYDAFEGVFGVGPTTAVGWTERGRVVTWDTATGKVLAEANIPSDKPGHRFKQVSASPDGRRLVADTDPGVVVLDTRTGKKLAAGAGSSAVFLGDGRAIGIDWKSKSADETEVAIRDLAGDTRRGRLTYPGGYYSRDWTLSPDGRLMVWSHGHKLAAVEVASGSVRWEHDLESESVREDYVRAVRVSADGRTLVLLRDKDVFAFDQLTGHRWGHQRPHMFDAYRHALSPDGRWLGTITDDWLVLYDLSMGGTEGHRFRAPLPFGTGVAFTADARTLLTAHRTGLCQSWDIRKWTATEPPPPRDPLKIPGDPAADPWAALADADAKVAGREIARLVQDPNGAVKLLGDKVEPVRGLDDKLIGRWVGELGDPDFKTRDTASKALATVPDQAATLLAEAAKAPASAEAGRRIAALLKIDPETVPDTLRILRALEVLEHVGTAAARKVVAKLADGAATAAITRHAKETLARMKPPAK